MTTQTRYAVIIGSGFPTLAGDGEGQQVQTRFGSPSAPVYSITLEQNTLLSLRRHGDDHSIPPHAINYRANLAALKELGAERVIALNTVGVITDIRESGQIAVPDQILDFTWGREHTIFDGTDGVVEHIDVTEPFSAALRQGLIAAAKSSGVNCHDGGVYAATQGPRLETAAEVDRLEKDGADYVGMTGMPEASLAMELGLDYACLAMIVNRAAGRGDTPIHQDVEASTAEARTAALALLREYFKAI
ncbi:MAG: S-methyl-5'-thioinosine phosphorylase [Woeseiaceae bacterium]